jgi:hypothetical protein
LEDAGLTADDFSAVLVGILSGLGSCSFANLSASFFVTSNASFEFGLRGGGFFS